MSFRGLLSAVLLAGAGAGTSALAEDAPAVPQGPKITWDRTANIKGAAERIGRIQRTQGADAAIKFIDACYRTHSLAETYSAAFEGCIAQDYLETKLLARIYSRLPDETLKKLNAPTAEALAQAMGRRVVAAFRQYGVTAAEADAFKTEVDTHGLPVFLKVVFPDAQGVPGADGKTEQNAPGDDAGKDKGEN